jgi:hypothetical protein
MRITLFILGLFCLLASGCQVISDNRVFPKLTWYWTREARDQRQSNREHEKAVREYQQSLKTNNPTK